MSSELWNPELVSARLRITPLVPADADGLVEVLSDPRLYLFTGGRPPELEELRARYERLATRVSPDGTQRWLNWVIRDAGSHRALGTLEATVHESGHSAEIAWVLGTAAQGRGYASEAARVLVDHLRTHGIVEVIAHVHPDHEASERVAAAIGMQPTEEWSEGERRWALPL